VVEPVRTPGGTRRYRASDLERLRLLKAATDAGHRIGALAGLGNRELEQLGIPPGAAPRDRLEEIFTALDAFDGAEAQRLLALQLSALGALSFAREIAMPLAREIGERWAGQRMRIPPGTLATAVHRSLLARIRPGATACAALSYSPPSRGAAQLGLQWRPSHRWGGANRSTRAPRCRPEISLRRLAATAALALSIVAPGRRRGATARGAAPGLPADVHLWSAGPARAR
jgi:hypothetical protein